MDQLTVLKRGCRALDRLNPIFVLYKTEYRPESPLATTSRFFQVFSQLCASHVLQLANFLLFGDLTEVSDLFPSTLS